jgi:type III secretory pathway lipoprotein EscJ
MVHASMMQNNTNEVENAKMVYKTAKLVRNSITNFSQQQIKTVQVSSTTDDVPADLSLDFDWI